MQCFKPIRIKKNLSPDLYPNGIEVGCGRCLGCRVHLRREWSLRCYHELAAHNDAVFVTLTYDNEHLPPHSSLSKRDAQLFIKRLRRKVQHKIRYILSGEYGDLTQRPHYHAVLFGLGYNLKTIALIQSVWHHCSYWSPRCFGFAEQDSISYVCGYLLKKYGTIEDTHDTLRPREPQFRLLSAGLGKFWCDENSADLVRDGHVKLRGHALGLPRYYLNRLAPQLPNTLSDHPLRVLLRDASEHQRAKIVEFHTNIYCANPQHLSHDKWLEFYKGNAAARSQHAATLYSKIKLTMSDKL